MRALAESLAGKVDPDQSCSHAGISTMEIKPQPDGERVQTSIIVPCYNGARYLPRLVECLQPLVNRDVEVIFVDDGSSDGSYEIFTKLMPNAIALWQPNRGLGATRNRAVELARGEFLQLLDVDDTIEPAKLEAQSSVGTSSGADVIYSDWRMAICKESGDVEFEQWINAGRPPDIAEALLGGWWFPPNAALIRTEAFRRIGGCNSELGNTCEDFDLWIRLAIAGCNYRHEPGRFATYYRDLTVRSMSRKNPREFVEGEARIILNAIRLLKLDEGSTPSRRSAAARRMHSVARNALKFDRSLYARLQRDVFRIDPKFRASGSFLYRLCCKVVGPRATDEIANLKSNFFGLSSSN